MGGGISLFYKTKTIELLSKTSVGFSKLYNFDEDKRFYAMTYFCASHAPSGLRLGGEIRGIKNKNTSKSDLFYNFFLAYSIDFNKLAALYPRSY